jgi:hypothetical protein
MSGFPGRRVGCARFGHAQAIVRRGEPLQFQWWGEDLSRNRNRRARCGGATGVYRIAEW